MRGFLSSILGVVMLLLLLKLYIAWTDTSRIDEAFSSYVKTISDVYERAELEDRVYDTLYGEALACKGLLAAGKLNIAQCNDAINKTMVALLATKGIVPTCPQPFALVPLPSTIKIVVVCPVEGKIDSAIFKIPLGAGVEA